MPIIPLPPHCRIEELVAALGSADALADDTDDTWTELELQIPSGCFVDMSAIAFLCSWGMRQIQAGRKLQLRGTGDAWFYLARMDLHAHLGLGFAHGPRHSEVGRFIHPQARGSDRHLDCRPWPERHRLDLSRPRSRRCPGCWHRCRGSVRQHPRPPACQGPAAHDHGPPAQCGQIRGPGVRVSQRRAVNSFS